MLSLPTCTKEHSRTFNDRVLFDDFIEVFTQQWKYTLVFLAKIGHHLCVRVEQLSGSRQLSSIKQLHLSLQQQPNAVTRQHHVTF